MRSLLIFLPIFLLSALETTVIPLNLTLLAVIVWSALRPAQQGLAVAFLAGLALDFLAGGMLGFSSLLFLAVTLLVYLYKNRFQADKLRFLLPFSLIVLVFYNLVFKYISWQTMIFSAALVIILLPILKVFSREMGDETQFKLTL